MENFDYTHDNYQVFKMFNDDWAIVCAGDINHYNALTIAWGSLGTIWGHSNKGRQIVTIYVSPARYTYEFLENSEYFTVSFFDEKYRNDVLYIGSHSGRNEDKISHTKLTPYKEQNAVAFKEAKLIFVCKKIYSDAFKKEKTPLDMQEGLYKKIPAHHFYIGEIIKVIKN